MAGRHAAGACLIGYVGHSAAAWLCVPVIASDNTMPVSNAMSRVISTSALLSAFEEFRAPEGSRTNPAAVGAAPVRDVRGRPPEIRQRPDGRAKFPTPREFFAAWRVGPVAAPSLPGRIGQGAVDYRYPLCQISRRASSRPARAAHATAAAS